MPTSHWYPQSLPFMWEGAASDQDDVYMMLVDDSYVYADSHETRADVTGEVTGGGYTAGGIQLEGLGFTRQGSGAEFTWDMVQWPPITVTARGAIVYVRKGGVPGSDLLLFHYDFGANVSVVGAPFVVFTPNPPPRAQRLVF